MKHKTPILLFIAVAIIVVGGLIVWGEYKPKVDVQKSAIDKIKKDLNSTDHCYIDWEKMELWARIDLRGERVVTCTYDVTTQTISESVKYMKQKWDELVTP